MTFNTKLLAGALALVLVAGMTSPAFAGGIPGCTIEPVKANLKISQNDGSDFVDKKITCTVTLESVNIDSETCVNYDVSILEPIIDDNMITFTEQVTNFGPLESEQCIVIFEVTDVTGSVEHVTQQLTINELKVAGTLLPTDSTALLLAGLSSMTPFMIPAVAGLAGAGIYLVKFRAKE